MYQPPEASEFSLGQGLPILANLSAEAGLNNWGDGDSSVNDWGNGSSSINDWGGDGSSVNGWGNGSSL